MKFDDYQEKLNHLTKLIERANTGSPKDLARKLNISDRTVRRLIDRLKLEDESIIYCRKLNSYIKN